MRYFSIRNFDKYQHYKHRRPPWIKLYNALLDDPDFFKIPPDQRWALVASMLLASQHENRVPCHPEWLKQRIGIEPDLELLSHWIVIDDASMLLASCTHDASNMLDQSRDRVEKKKIPASENPDTGFSDLPEEFLLAPNAPPSEPAQKPRAQANHTTRVVDAFCAEYKKRTGNLYISGRPRMNSHISQLCKGINWLWVEEAIPHYFDLVASPPTNGKGKAKWEHVDPSIESFCRHSHDLPNYFKFNNSQEVQHG